MTVHTGNPSSSQNDSLRAVSARTSWTDRVVATALGLVFVMYGLVKVLGSQFHYGPFVLDRSTVDGPSMVWCFFGFSQFYGRFIGVAELVPGLLLLVPATRTLGALMLFPIVLNITIMDYAFDFPPVKHAALLYTAACAFLLFRDRPKFRALFWSRERATRAASLLVAAERGELPVRPVTRTRGRLVAVLLLAPALVFLTNLTLTAIDTGPQDAAALRCMAEGYPKEAILLRRTWMEGQSGIGRRGRALFELDTEPGQYLVVDLVKNTGFHDWHAIAFERTNARPEGLPAAR